MLWNYDRRVLAILALFVFATICEPSRRSLSSVTLLTKYVSFQLLAVQILAYTCTIPSSLRIKHFKVARA